MTLWSVLVSFVLAFCTIAFIRMVRVRYPRYYFSLGEIVITEREDISAMGLVTKFAPPFVGSLIIGIIPLKDRIGTVLLYTFLSSFLVVWPVVLSPNELLSLEAKRRIRTLYFIYFVFIALYVGIGQFALFVLSLISKIRLRSAVQRFMDLYPTLHPFWHDVLGGVVGGIPLLVLSVVFRALIRRLRKKIREDSLRAAEINDQQK